ncbi:MAG: hypothetical protein WC525_10125 [Candidatus Thermoplasmatota archaeon]
MDWNKWESGIGITSVVIAFFGNIQCVSAYIRGSTIGVTIGLCMMIPGFIFVLWYLGVIGDYNSRATIVEKQMNTHDQK